MSLWGNKDDKTSTGTIQVFANGKITGTTTSFDTEAAVGDNLVVNTTVGFIISEIRSATDIQVVAQNPGTSVNAVSSGTNYTLNERPIFVSFSEGADSAGYAGDQTKVFGMDTTEEGVESGGIIKGIITNAGTGYTANASITVSGGGGSSGAANAQAAATGKIEAINIETAGSSYETNPTLTIAAPASTSFNALSEVSNTADTITISSAGSFEVGDAVTYAVAAGNTAVGGLEDGTTYFVSFANSTVLALGTGVGQANIDLTASVSETGHTLTGVTATATAVVGGSQKGGTHAGWVRRVEGTGGRAGRVHFETLVAMGSIAGDAADNDELPNS